MKSIQNRDKISTTNRTIDSCLAFAPSKLCLKMNMIFLPGFYVKITSHSFMSAFIIHAHTEKSALFLLFCIICIYVCHPSLIHLFINILSPLLLHSLLLGMQEPIPPGLGLKWGSFWISLKKFLRTRTR